MSSGSRDSESISECETTDNKLIICITEAKN